MARNTGWLDLSMPGRKSGGFNATFYGADALSEALEGIADGLVWTDKGDLIPAKLAANREMRAAAKDIAEKVLIPQMKRTARVARTKIAPAMAETARAKSDRLIMVQVGGVNPPLSGFRRGVGVKRAKGRTGGKMRDATSKTFRTTLAWGSEFGPLGGRRQPSRGNNIPSGPVNHYKAPRNYPNGYWVTPAVQDSFDQAVALWEAAVMSIVDRYVRGRM